MMRRSLSFVWVAVLSLGAVTGCGGDDDTAKESPSTQFGLKTTDAADPGAQQVDAVDEEDTGELGKLEFLLPESTEPPTGFRTSLAECEVTDEEDRYHTPYAYAVPDDWVANGQGKAGSGLAAFSVDIDTDYDTGEGAVEVDLERPRTDDEGTMVDHDGEPWVSFDYDVELSSSDSVTEFRITYEDRGSISVAGKESQLFFLDQAQEPVVVSASEYKTIIDVAMLPSPAYDDRARLRTQSLIVTLSFDAARGGLDEETARGIIESFALPACSREPIVIEEEMQHQADLDGDGKVSTVEDFQAMLAR